MKDKNLKTITHQIDFHVMATENSQKKYFRPWISMIIDVRSRTIIGHRVIKPKEAN